MAKMKFTEAIRDAYDTAMTLDPNVFLVGVGLIDPKAVFGTLQGLLEKYGSDRVVEGPLAEQMLTGMAFGAALTGLKPVLIHHRVDFLPLTFDQIASHMAKWKFMFGNQQSVPCVIRGIVGRGWGNGPQHTQSLHSFAANVPGLKVVVPATAEDAKGLMMSAIFDPDPVIFIDHRWNHNDEGEVPAGDFRIPIGKAQVMTTGSDLTLVTVGPLVKDAVKAAEKMKSDGVSVEVINLRSIRPIDFNTIGLSLRKTGHLLIVDADWPHFGVASAIISELSQREFSAFKKAPATLTWPDHPVPASQPLENLYYPDTEKIISAATKLLRRETASLVETRFEQGPSGVLSGPF